MNHAYTSVSRVKDLRRPDQRTPMKVLVKKKYNFVELFWAMFVTQNKVDLMYVVCISIRILMINFYRSFTIYREVDDEDEEG